MLKASLSTLVFLAILGPSDALAELRVVATVPDLAAIAQEIGGKDTTVESMSLTSQDPHFVDAKPSLALAINKADLVIAVGLQLEGGWLPTLLTGARNGAIQLGGAGYLEVAQLVRLLGVPKGPIDRSMGDIHPGGNPHFLNDPRAAAAVAEGIAARFKRLDAKHGAEYDSRLKAFLAKLSAAREKWEARLSSFRGTKIVAHHRTWIYLADWLGLEEVEFLEPKPGIPPTPTHVAMVIAVAREQKVRLIVQEDYYSEGTGKLVAQKIPATFLKLPAATRFQKGQSYLEHLEEMLAAFEHALVAGKGN